MSKKTIMALIDKVVGDKGIFRAPAWWMKKLLTEINNRVDALESRISKLGNNISALSKAVEELKMIIKK